MRTLGLIILGGYLVKRYRKGAFSEKDIITPPEVQPAPDPSPDPALRNGQAPADPSRGSQIEPGQSQGPNFRTITV